MLRGTSHTLKLLLLEPVSDDSTSALCLGQRYPKRDALLGNNKGCWGSHQGPSLTRWLLDFVQITGPK